MNNFMKENFQNKDIAQHFCDCTYYCTPPHSRDEKLFELLAFYIRNKKSLLMYLALIKYENSLFSIL